MEITMLRLALASSAFALSAATVAAAPAVGLAGDRTLVLFDTETLEVAGTMEVDGVERLHGLDLRPSNGTLVGVTDDDRLVTIDWTTGAATHLATLSTPLPAGGAAVVVDFNPVADRLRLMTGTTNHRVHPDTGEVTVDGSLAFEAGDANEGAEPGVVAAAYTNSFGSPEATAMYDVDAGLGALLQQTAPNDGTLVTIGMLGIEGASGPMAFDVQTTEDGTNTAWLIVGNVLHEVSLETGAPTAQGEIGGAEEPIRDVAVLPAM
jgi:hypothetical protein